MNEERLMNVARAARDVHELEAHFDMHTVHRCGTPACVLGHYVARRDLQEFFQLPIAGSEWIRPTRKEWDWHWLETNSIATGVWGATRILYGWMSLVAHHFDITRVQADLLFSMNGCGGAKTALEAAVFIENFIAREKGHEIGKVHGTI